MNAAQPLILVVDDDEDDRLFVQLAFEEDDTMCGQVAFATDGLKALEWLTAAPQPPALVLLDMNMPRLSGLELLKKLRETPRWRGLPVVMFTTSGEEIAVERAYELGANSYVTKPDSYENFGRLLKDVCHYWLGVARLPSQVRVRESV